MSVKKFLFALMGVGLCGIAVAGREAIHLEQPRIWYAFDNQANGCTVSGGSASLTFSNSTQSNWGTHDDAAGGYIYGNGSNCPHGGSSLPLADGDWTILARAKVSSTANSIVHCAGAISSGKYGLAMYSGGSDTVKFSIINDFTNFVSTLSVAVPNATTAWHDYACVFTLADRLVTVYVDGVAKGTVNFANFNRTNTAWQWFSIYGGLGASGLTVGDTATMLDDYRVYTRALTVADLTALHEGRTQVPVYGGFLTASDATIWRNTQVKDIVRLRMRHGGTSIIKDWSVPFYLTRTSTNLLAQMQQVVDSRYNKVTKIALTQTNTTDIVGKILYARYIEPSNYSLYGTQGNDFDIQAGTTGTLAVGNQTGGYGLFQLTADLLTDDNAAVWADDAWAAAAPVAGQAVSFRSGSGTWSNTLPAGTAYGRLAFGAESGRITVAGNAGSFSEVVNAGTAAQAITMPLTYTGDFAPETWGPLAFTDLSVAGTFQPVGSGAITFHGTTTLGVADVRYNVRTTDWDPTCPGTVSTWANNKGYAAASKQPTYSLTTAPGGLTTIGRLQGSWCGQRRQTLYLDGNFSIGGDFQPGNDGVLVITNGTTTFTAGYTVNSTYGTNPCIVIAPDGTLTLPMLSAPSAIIIYNSGTVNAGNAQGASSASYSTQLHRNGTFNASRMSGSFITMGATIGAEGSALGITGPLSFSGVTCATTGVTFRTSSPAGAAARIEMTGTLTPYAVPLAITGGGSFAYKTGGALTFAALSVGANTTADFTSCSSVTLTNTTLAAGAKLMLPAWNGSTSPFVSKPTLPADGRATIALEAANDLAAGTYTLASAGFTADDLAHLTLTLTGAAASGFTVTCAVTDAGALTATVATVAQTGAYRALLNCSGYTGTETLTNFPVLVKLPAGVTGFAYSQVAANGADLWFADENGNRIPHEIETWNTSGESFVWVRIPQMRANTPFSMRWGGGTASVPALSDTATFDSRFLGVWHFNSVGSTTADSSPCKLVMTAKGTTANLSGATGPIGTSYFSKGSAYYETPNAASWLAYSSTKKLTISGWIKTTSTTANQRIVSSKKTWNSAGGFEITTRGTAATELLAGGSNNSQYTKGGITNYKNNWVHFTVIYDGTQTTPVSRMYINGTYVNQATGANYNPQTKSDPLALGAAPGGSSPYSGGMDEIRLAKVVESANWIKAAYTTQASPTTFVTAQAVVRDSPYDFRALSEANTVNEDTGAYPVYAGVATTLTTAGTGALVIEPGKKAIVPGWEGPIENLGWLTLTRGSTETVAPASGTTEYAADHVITYGNPTKPIVCSGNVLFTSEYGAFSFLESPLTITAGVTTLASSSGIVRFGEQNNAPMGTYGARLIMTGGRLQAQETTLDYSGYTEREMSITLSGDSVFTVPIRAWQNSVDVECTNMTVRVGGTANFAPESFGWRNTATLVDVGRLFVTLSENGRFTAPADGIATYVRLTVGAGTPHLTAAANSAAENRGILTLPAAGTLAIDGDNATIVNAGTIQGTGALVVDAGGILDLTDDAGVTTNFTGSLTVKNGGILILPADQVPTYRLALEAGARVIATVSEAPDGTAKFLGALASTPSSGTATIEFDLPQSIPLNAVYTLSTSELPAGAADSLAIAFTGAAGETTAGTITLDETGAVKVTVTASEAKGELVWTGAGQVTTDTGVLTWTLKDSADATVYPFSANLPIWFTDTASARTVTVADAVKPSTATFNTAETYELRGSAKIDATTVVKDGTGTLVVNGQGFAAPANVLVKAGTLKLGDAAVKNALGTKDTTVTVESGATLDLNTNLPSSGDTARGAATSDNLIIITGDGVDGKGAIWDSNPYTANWHFQLGRVCLVGDASIRGAGRIDLRKASTSTFDGRAALTGGDDVTLTAGVQVPETVNCGLNFNGTDIAIGKIVVDTDSSIGFEGDTTVTAPHGIELKSGARIQYWNAAAKKTPIVVTGTGAGLKASSSAANTQDAPVTVQEGASLDLRGETTLTYSSAFANAGETTISAATHVFTGSVTNTGSFKQTGGTLTLNATNYAGVLTMNQTGGTCNLGGDISALPVALTMTGGALWWGIGATYPTIGESNVDVSGITGGTLYFSASGNATIPQAFAQAKPKDVYVYNATESQATTLPAGDFALSGTLHIGKPALPGALKLSDGTSLTAGTLYLGDEAASPKATLFEVGPGASANFTASGHSQIGRWSGASTAKHEVRVTGGSLAFSDTLAVGLDAEYAYLTLTEGLISLPGLAIRERLNYVSSPYDERFTMTGGTFEIGSYNLWTARRRYEGVHADLQAGIFKARANTSVSTYGMLVATGATMGSEGEGLTIDLNGKTVTQTLIPHFGASAVTLTGAGTYTTSAEWQGIVAGKWTVDTETSANVDLSGFAGFAGGLELKDNTTAKIAIAGDGTVEYGYIPGSFDNGYTHVSTNGPLPTVVSNLKRIHTQYNTGSPANSGAFVLRGQFYVPEEDAGTWTFAGNFDDNIGLWIDGTQVFKSANYTSIGRGETTLTAGWHDFIVVTYDGTGGQGPCVGNWAGKKALGWRKGSSTSTEANDYLIFDTSTLAMRAKPPVKADSEVTTYRIAGTTYGTYDKLKAIADSAWGTTPYASGTTLQASLNTVNQGFQQQSAQKFVGGFLVDATHEGEWTFTGSWDDSIILKIDGLEVLHNTKWDALATSKVTLNAGWHAFEIRTADGTGGYGTDAKGINGGYGLAVVRPGDTAKQPFDERTVRVTMQAIEAAKVLPAGLDGTTTLGAGATLVNGGAWSHLTEADKAGRFCPIRGTLEGSGTLSGPYRFVGTNHVWALAADHRRITGAVAFANADAQTLAGLKTIRLDFTERPRATEFKVGPALGLTAASAAALTVRAPIPSALRTAQDGTDTDFAFTAKIKDDNLILVNAHPVFGTVIFVR